MHFRLRLIPLLVLSIIATNSLLAQNSGVINGQDTTRRVITTAVPFLSIAPDPKSGAMGDVGAATEPDANATFWNPAKLAFLNQKSGVALSFTPWLKKYVDDMSLSYLSGFYQLDNEQTFGLSMTYFDLGDIELTDGSGGSLGSFNPREFAIAASYSRKLSNNLSLGVTGKFIHSNLSGNISTSPVTDPKPGTSIAADIGVYHKSQEFTFLQKPSQFSYAAVISNIGSKITYNSADEEDFIPTNLRIGGALTSFLDPYNKITLALDLNKLMVPTPQPDGSEKDKGLLEGMFGSFADAPDGFSEELQEIMYSVGAEYEYREAFALRAGYFYENANKGNRKYFTFGVGAMVKKFEFNFSYLIPQFQDHPLAETLRFGVLIDFSKSDN
ncbi:type IX secretion system outer membrane channel protein PorV [Roseivirga pacifica]|uniref:type IX secretion system outer membrane channel protein PorV n=1 Tax=Roseivirga pacifica TaxID=1267423 RepID=UPI00209605DA|nr:type IX secretion system outer membrane channel protein PorV [Roseivirga pacifica]MCO6357895.1 type IX secretion system outer membrane channel protein PorV [Roseivirga pacifica]MCO6366147.1 type IX secretion system outer membrane channel protein PorV [Roseivirga pacifica]MCO6371475.1 type IX secretion system outer membrane channel protein PorV [Roseivirga pacifica]MCO6375353.1 type IX secretion system outer membrane channel protein PorV [Roseivirga pacifica]MCO6378853.1 type IX secretion sy